MSDVSAAEVPAERHPVPEALRADVRLLGGLLGQVLKEAGGQELYEDVESLRALTIEAYTNFEGDAIHRAEALVESFTPERAEGVAKAFSAYFHLVNLAEENDRVRSTFAGEASGSESADDSFDALPQALQQLTEELGADEARARLAGLEFRSVLTAHPTEARRRAVASAIRRITVLLAQRDGADGGTRLGGTSLAENQRALLAEIETLWRTSPLRSDKPTPLDEVRGVMGFFDETLFNTLPEIYRRLDDWMLGDKAGTIPPVAPAFVKMGTWIGGDRDGNPNVTASTTKAAAAIASEHVLLGLQAVATRVGRSLTLDSDSTPPSAELDALWQRQRQLDEGLARDIDARGPNEPYRRSLVFIAERIRATRKRNSDLSYSDPDQLIAELLIIQQSLVAAKAERAGFGELQRLIWQVQSFGFHLAELEVRQHSKVHERALADIEANGIDGELDPMTVEVLDVFRTIATVQKRHGMKAARRYIVSFTQKPEHMAAVYKLAEYASQDSRKPVIDAIPLFETFADLQASTDIMEEVLKLPEVQKRLDETDRRIEVMLGYSDSSKDVGPVSATLALYEAQSRISEWAKRNDLKLTLFHGRGGALGRGGGPVHQAIMAQPPGSVSGRFKVTEQGEVIAARYGNPTIASRHIQEVAAATLLSSAPSIEKRNSEAAERFADMAATMDKISRDRFNELVKAPGFPQWFAQVTPLEELGLLPLGSRPARRGLSVESLEDLRAIPWVFSWTQARTNLAGWFGLGTTLETIGDLELLQEAYRDWPLFTTTINNVEMGLAKADSRIAAKYLELGDRDDLRDLVLGEFKLTLSWVLKITGSEKTLSSTRTLGRAVQLRAPYIDALSLIQLRALRALRAGVPDEQVAPLQRLLLLTVNGIAAGLQNTG